MESREIGLHHILRLDPGEEIVSSIIAYCEWHSINLGTVSAIGAVNEVKIGLFDPSTKTYSAQLLKGNFEIIALSGSVTTKEERVYLHLHIGVGDEEHKMYGGHLEKGIVSATCEIFIHAIEGEVDRAFNDNIGLNLLEFKD